jgi:hypothetical protein
MKPSEVDLSEAGNTYLIANTPLFLARRLQTDSSADLLSRLCSCEDLYAGIVDALQKDPENSIDAVRPFMYLIALRGQETPDLFFKAAELHSRRHPWYTTVARVLEATFIPQVNESIWVGVPQPTFVQYPPTPALTELAETEKV